MDFNFDTSTISSILALDPGSSNLTVMGTAGAVVPTGTTAQRSAATGAIRFNTNFSMFEIYDGSTWANIQPGNSNLSSLSSLSGTGIVVQTGAGTFAERWVVPVSGQTIITNGDGVSGNISIGLANAGVSGTYVSVTTDQFGRVTSGNTTQAWSTITGTPTTLNGYGITDAYTMAQTANLTWNWSSVTNTPTTISGYGITDAISSTDLSNHASDYSLHLTSSQNSFIDNISVTSTEINYLTGVTGNVQTQLGGKLSLTGGAMSGNIVMQTGTHITVSDAPENATDAVNKNYVDSLVTGLSWKDPVNSIGASLPGTATTGDRFLNTTDDKIYTATATNTWNAGVVPADGWAVFDKTDETGYVFNGTDWIQFTGTGQITAGVGLAKTGNQLDVNLGAGIAQLPSDEVGIDLYTPGGLWLTLDGLSASTSNLAQIGVRADGGTITVTSSGIKVSANSISETHLTSSVAGTGLTGGDGNPLALATIGSAGTHNLITHDAYGRVTAGANVAYLTSNQTISVTGDVTGSGTTSIATTLANVGTAGTYVSVTTDEKGRVTAGSTSQAWSTISSTPTTLSGYGITDAVKNNGTVPSFQSGTFGNIVAAGTAGAMYVTSDTNAIYRDNGTSWVQVGEAGLLYTENPVSPVASTVTGDNAVSIGSNNTAAGTTSLVTGDSASTAIYGAEVRANGSFAVAGDAQAGKYVLRNRTTSTTQTELFLDGVGGSARVALVNNSAVAYSALVVAHDITTAATDGAWKIEGLVKRGATPASTALVGNRSKTTLTRPNASWDVEVYADTSNGALTFKVTGPASDTVRWVATVTTSEVNG